jgi:RNA polymerase sigma-70 factor (ECF subfamily)
MDIVEELRQNRESGARRLEAEYKAGLMTLARRFYVNESDAEELVNSTFATVVENIDDYIEQSAFFAWMCQILNSIFLQRVRRKSNRMEVCPGVVPDIADEKASEMIYSSLDATFLREAIAELPEEQREVIVLRYFVDMPIAKMAKFLSIPSGTIRSRLFYARKALAAKLGVAAKKPGVKALLVALALAALTAIGAAVVTAVGTLPRSVRDSDALEGGRFVDGGRFVEASLPEAKTGGPSAVSAAESSAAGTEAGPPSAASTPPLTNSSTHTLSPTSQGENMNTASLRKVAAALAPAYLATGVAMSPAVGYGNVLQVTADATWTETMQSEIDGSDGIEIFPGVTLTLNIGSGQTLSITKVISGDGNLVKDGAGRLDLRGENTFAGQFTIGGAGNVYAYSDGAFGSTAGKTLLYEYLFANGAGNTGADGANLYLCGITTSEPIKIIANSKTGYLHAADGTVNVLNGQLELAGGQASIYARSNSTLYIRGGVVKGSNGTCNFRPSADSGAKIIVENAPNAVSLWNSVSAGGEMVLNAAGNAGGYTYLPIRCGVDWAFNNAGIGWKNGGSHMKVDLGGHPQRVTHILAASGMNGHVTSTDKAFLYVTDSDANRTSYLPFKGKAGLFFEGTGKTTLYAVSETAGDLTVTNGTVAFASAASWRNVDAVTVSGNGRLELSADRQIGQSAAMALAGNGVLKTADGTVTIVRSLTVNGVPMQDGVTYGNASSPAQNTDHAGFFEGTGTVLVMSSFADAAVWDGGAGAADFFAAANWVGDPADLDLTHGLLTATFAMAGTTRLSASLGANAALKGIVFDNVASFGLAGTGSLTLGENGLRAPAAADRSARAFQFDVPLNLATGAQRWDIGSNVTVRVASLSSDADTALAVHGTGKDSGRLVLDGANAGFAGTLLLSNVVTSVSGPDAFGTSAASTTIYAQDAREGAFTNAVELCGTTNAEPFSVVCNMNGQYAFRAKSGTRNVLNGAVDFSVTSMKVYLEANSEIVFAGGGRSGSRCRIRPMGVRNGRIVVAEKPVSWDGVWADGAGGEFVLSVASNTFAGAFFCPMPVRCTVPYARWQGSVDFNAGGGAGTNFELEGNDQCFSEFTASRGLKKITSGNRGGINSATPATVYLDDTADCACEADFSGAVSLVKRGPHTLTLNWFSTSTGTVTVANGTLRFGVLETESSVGTICGSWSNATAFAVCDTGRLEAAHGGVFGPGTDIRLDGPDARIELADGTVQMVGEVILNGRQGRKHTTYGGLGSDARVKDARILGTGMLLTTKGLPSGTVVILQ